MRGTIDDALAEFTLISGVGSEAEKQACAMSLLAWLDECDEWTDRPLCAHPVITDQVILANDADTTTAAMRAELVRLGAEGVLDTWWIPVEVIVWTLSGEPGEAVSQYERTVRSLRRIAAWKLDRQRPNLFGANLYRANLSGANLSRAYLRRADLSGANLFGANLFGANLRRANLRRANLSGANLSRAYLRRADLFGANLYRANLSGANLSRANLRRANLFGANLSEANLSGANLYRAYLSGANLYRAYLSGADLSGANLYRAYLSGANLSEAYGIPSTGAPAGWVLVDDLWQKAP